MNPGVAGHPGVAVAPLAGSVDRNSEGRPKHGAEYVAPLAGSVDRNEALAKMSKCCRVSLPSRGAWIEIDLTEIQKQQALRRSPRGERG